MAKDFSKAKGHAESPDDANIGVNIDNVTTTKGQRVPATEEEIQKRKSKLNTRGVLGAKVDRVNLSITPENLVFVKTMARLKGMYINEYINFLIQQYREAHPDIVERAQALIDEVENSNI